MTPEKAARWRFLEGGIVALEKGAPRPARTPTIDPRVKRLMDMTPHQKPLATPGSVFLWVQAHFESLASINRSPVFGGV